jgi:hypothetical protein
MRATICAQELLSDILQRHNVEIFGWLQWWNHLVFERRNNSFLLYHFVNTEITFIFHLILRFMHVFKALSEDVFFGFFSMLVHFYFPMLGSFEVIIVVLQDLKL